MDDNDYLESAIKLFRYYKKISEQAMAQVPDEQLFSAYNEDSNSIATIVKHLSGNMLSRWTDFLTSDGEKPWRDRDGEFENTLKSRDEMMQSWEKGWNCMFDTLNALKADDLSKIIFIRNEGQKVVDAINRQLAHYSYHTGQIVLLAKQLHSGIWQSLTIPKGKSQKFNSDKFSKPKENKHFADN